jgi:hypothetical protein
MVKWYRIGGEVEVTLWAIDIGVKEKVRWGGLEFGGGGAKREMCCKG